MGLMKAFILFGAGVYTGIYSTQNYDIPSSESPKEMLKKVKDYIKQFEKKKNVVESTKE
jgi:hypothetical protein